jgi:ABC-type molybdate transport system ATPase subunit
MLDLVDRLVVLANGRVAADGPKHQVLEVLKENAVQERSRSPRKAVTFPARR